jgi:hypothetical protein
MAAAGRPPDMRAAGYLEALVRGDGGQGPLARVLPATIRAGERVRRIGTLLRGEGPRCLDAPPSPRTAAVVAGRRQTRGLDTPRRPCSATDPTEEPVVLLTECRRQTPRLRPVSVRRAGRRSGCT